jgi:hypothetical protein
LVFKHAGSEGEDIHSSPRPHEIPFRFSHEISVMMVAVPVHSLRESIAASHESWMRVWNLLNP